MKAGLLFLCFQSAHSRERTLADGVGGRVNQDDLEQPGAETVSINTKWGAKRRMRALEF